MGEQTEIVRRAETHFSFADRLKPSVLAFHSELVPQDPNDEPAAELLLRFVTIDHRQKIGKRTHINKATIYDGVVIRIIG